MFGDYSGDLLKTKVADAKSCNPTTTDSNTTVERAANLLLLRRIG